MCLKCISAEWKKIHEKWYEKVRQCIRGCQLQSKTEAGIYLQSLLSSQTSTSDAWKEVHDIPRGRVSNKASQGSSEFGHNGERALAARAWALGTGRARWGKRRERFVRPKSEILRKITNRSHSYGRTAPSTDAEENPSASFFILCGGHRKEMKRAFIPIFSTLHWQQRRSAYRNQARVA